LTQSKKQQQNSIAIVFRFVVAGIFFLNGAPAPNPGRCASRCLTRFRLRDPIDLLFVNNQNLMI
jgi:hypothetical protein